MTSESVNAPELDSVLQIALFDRKSRMFVLRLEQIVQCFVRGANSQMDFPGPMNSYFRLIAHKIADYYHVGHVSSADGSTVTLFLENSISSELPKPLCDYRSTSDLDAPSTEEKRPPRRAMLLKKKKDTNANTANTNTSNINGNDTQANEQRTNDMTNDTNNESNDNDNTNTNNELSDEKDSNGTSPSVSTGSTVSSQTPKGRGSLEARSAAYEEARARIFSTPAARDEAAAAPAGPDKEELDSIEETYSRKERYARNDADYSRQMHSAPLPPYSAPPGPYYYQPQFQQFQHPLPPPPPPPPPPPSGVMPMQPYYYPVYPGEIYYPNGTAMPFQLIRSAPSSVHSGSNSINSIHAINSAPNSRANSANVTPDQSHHASRSSTPSYRRNHPHR
ncbi:hypothetical protein TRVA0_015S02322 [Trichomonascus vanleenenianus]|uniref:Rbs1p n=1 Tax=Trichomonascus vanleenenianus TaxID=2268995 RepID=UPI003ECB7EEC